MIYFITGGVRVAINAGGDQMFFLNTIIHGVDLTNNQQHDVHFWTSVVNGFKINLQVI